MSIYSSVTVSLDFDNNKLIKWSLKNSFRKKCGGKFVVEWAEPGGDFTPVNAEPIDESFYIIKDIRRFNPDRNTYYRVGYVDKLNGVTYYSDPVREGFSPLNATDWKYIRTILRRECLTLKFSGVPGVLLKRRISGDLCPACVDPSIEAQSTEYCPVCEGTGFVGGYYPPIDFTLNLKNHPNHSKEHNPDLGANEPGIVIQATCVNYPWVDTDDLWVSSSTNDRFVIRASQPQVVYKDMPLTAVLTLVKQNKSMANIINSAEVNYKVSNEGKQNEGHPAWDGDVPLTTTNCSL